MTAAAQSDVGLPAVAAETRSKDARASEPPIPVDPNAAVIVFDGVCLLCNAWVDFLLRHDRRGRYRFAAMQGRAGRALLAMHGLDPDDPLSFLLVEGALVDGALVEGGTASGVARTNSDAVLAVVEGLGGAWRMFRVLRLLPQRLRDAGYRLIARRRYDWFGRRSACRIPGAERAARFLDS